MKKQSQPNLNLKVNSYSLCLILSLHITATFSAVLPIVEKSRYTITTPTDGLCGTHSIIHDPTLDLYITTCAWGTNNDLRILLLRMPDWHTSPQIKGTFYTRTLSPYWTTTTSSNNNIYMETVDGPLTVSVDLSSAPASYGQVGSTQDFPAVIGALNCVRPVFIKSTTSVVLGTYFNAGTPADRYLYILRDINPGGNAVKINIPDGLNFILQLPNS